MSASIALFQQPTKPTLDLVLRWRRLTLGTNTEEEEIWRGLRFLATYQFASLWRCSRCVCSLHLPQLSSSRLHGWFSRSSLGISLYGFPVQGAANGFSPNGGITTISLGNVFTADCPNGRTRMRDRVGECNDCNNQELTLR